MIKKLFILLLFIFTFVSLEANAKKGCCSKHDGVSHCDSDIGILVCNDGSYSPTCTCKVKEKDKNCLSGNCYDGEGEYLFKDGSKYIGKFKNGQIIDGKILYSDGTIYIGELNKSVPNGQGTFIETSKNKKIKAILKGSFKDGNLNGKGEKTITFTNALEEIYTGNFKDNKLNGTGKKRIIIGNEIENIYTGNFKNDTLNGIGEYKSTFKSTFSFKKGNFKDDKLNGTGEYIDGHDKYTGNFKNDKLNGKGEILFGRNKDFRYKGYLKNSLPEGKGEYIFKNGDRLISGFKNGFFYGDITYIELNGSVYKSKIYKSKFNLLDHKVSFLYLNNKKIYLGYDEKNKYSYFEDNNYIGDLIDGKHKVLFITTSSKYFIHFKKGKIISSFEI